MELLSTDNQSYSKAHYLLIVILFGAFLTSGCGITIPKYTSIHSEQPPNYYLGESPNIKVVQAEGATRRMQDITIQELRNQSRSRGHFTIENSLSEGIRFDSRDGKLVMTGKETEVNEEDVFIKFNVIASMKQDKRTTVTRPAGTLGLQEKQVPAMVTIMPVAFTLTRGDEVLLNERQYNGQRVWTIDENGGGYPSDYRRRFEAAIGQAVDKFLTEITPKTVSQDVRLDYSDEKQKPMLDAARDGQVKQAATQLEEYVQNNPNSASAVYNLAVLTDALGDYNQAIDYYDKALSLGGKDYYTDAKSSCMRRMNEQDAMNRIDTAGNPDSTSSNIESQDSNSREEQNSGNKPGDGGEDIEWIQNTLNSLGYECGTADGAMGPNTHSCIRSFQKAHDLKVTGSINESTYNSIVRETK
ncbi:MAG: peptidoglycan-binding protein [Balneolaceae bacterium]|nr:peptidoglycan-binding protein [Balneolaceae bacterium]